jgi:hypothetical protein
MRIPLRIKLLELASRVWMMKWPAEFFVKGDSVMNILAKCMTAIAISALVAGPAAAVEFNVSYVGTKGSIKLWGSGCSDDRDKNLAVNMAMFGSGFIVDPDALDFDSGPNTGLFDAFIEGVELGEFDGEGTFVIEKRGKDVTEAPKRAVLGLSEDFFGNVVDEMADFAAVECKNFEDFSYASCQQVKGSADWSKDGQQLKFKVEVECYYLDTGDKSQKVQVRIVSGKLDWIEPS